MKKVTFALLMFLAATFCFAQAPALPPSKQSAEQKLAKLTPDERKQFEAHAKALGLDPKALAGHDLATSHKQLEAKKATLGTPAVNKRANLPPVAPGPQGAGQQQAQALAQANAQVDAQTSGQAQDLIKKQQQMVQQMQDLLKKMNDAQNQALQNVPGGK
jgi:hypothetical protein